MTDPAHDDFNRGVSLSLEAQQLRATGDHEAAQEREAQSLAAFDRALENDPAHAAALGAKAFCLAQMGSTKDSIEWFRKAIEIEPQMAENHKQLGLSLFQVGDFGAANDSIAEAVRIKADPEYTRHTSLEVYNLGHFFMNQAETSRDQGRHDGVLPFLLGARATFHLAGKLDPENSEAKEAFDGAQELLVRLSSGSGSSSGGLLGKIKRMFGLGD
ncbi:MAG: tetratricopeptide repeat protein [Holophagales bacterium]|nr:tetratricopeptide repeat protein [Holophagales bacterium]